MSFQLLKNTAPALPEHVVVKRSTRAKRIALRLDPQSRLFHLVVPKGTSVKRAQLFALEHEEWMQNRLQELAPQILFVDGAVIPLFGQKTRIDIQRDNSLKRTAITLENNELIVRTPMSDPSPRIKRFLKALAKEKLNALSLEKATRIKKSVKAVYVRDTKTRWGSCSSDNNLSYSWRLIFAPYELFDYVVAHEVAHLKYLDHSKAFWSVCRNLSDNYLDGKYWMQAHGQELMRYG